MRLTVATREAIRFACIRFHYARSVPVSTIGFNVYNGAGEWCGVVLYGRGATPNIGSEYGLKTGEALELVRVALNGKQEATSQAVAASLKLLREKCPLCRLVVSFADCDQSHLGTIYQATNWIYVGTVKRGECTAFIVHGRKMHPKTVYSHKVRIGGRVVPCPQTIQAVRRFFDPAATEFRTLGKRKYLYPLDKRTRKRILPLARPYPKNEDWKPIDYRAKRAAKKKPAVLPAGQ